jgi:hypothetical protein
VDEFNPSLRHDSFGILSSANSGPDSNGAQYFITVSAQPQLDDVHSVFGRLYGGSNVVYAINHVVTGANDKPLTNVVVNSVNIRRIGTAAQAFDINTNGLPLVTNLNVKIASISTNVSLTFSNQLNVENRVYTSTDLAGWTGASLGVEVAAPVTNAVYRSVGGPQQFFRMAQVQYPPSLYVPRTVRGKTVTLDFAGGYGTVVVTFDNAGAGTYTWTLGSPGVVQSYSWVQDPYRGRLWPIYFSGIIPMVLHLDFDNPMIGTFKGTAYPNIGNPFAVSGTFSSAP